MPYVYTEQGVSIQIKSEIDRYTQSITRFLPADS